MRSKIFAAFALPLAILSLSGCNLGTTTSTAADTSLTTNLLRPLLNSCRLVTSGTGLASKHARTVQTASAASDLATIKESGYDNFVANTDDPMIAEVLEQLIVFINEKGIASNFNGYVDWFVRGRVSMGSDSDSSSSTKIWLSGPLDGTSSVSLFVKINHDTDKNYELFLYTDIDSEKEYWYSKGSITNGSCEIESTNYLLWQEKDSSGGTSLACATYATNESDASDTKLYLLMGYMGETYAGVLSSLGSSGTFSTLRREYYKNGDLLAMAEEIPADESPTRSELSWDWDYAFKFYPLRYLEAEKGYTIKVDTQSSGFNNFWLEKDGGSDASAYNEADGDIDLVQGDSSGSERYGSTLYRYSGISGDYSSGVQAMDRTVKHYDYDDNSNLTITTQYYQALQLGSLYNLSSTAKTNATDAEDKTPYVKLWPGSDTTTAISTINEKLTATDTSLKTAHLMPLKAKLEAGDSSYSTTYQNFKAGSYPTEATFF